MKQEKAAIEMGMVIPLNIIRSETTLSRFPIHHLCKQGKSNIEICRRNPKGEVTLKWVLSYSDRHGQPGLFGYKLDTLVINRHIEKVGYPVPEILPLGSLRDICRELGKNSESGKNREDIKKALRQNAGALIDAKLVYRMRNGHERTLEATFHRYSVVFTGETLPDGRKAEQVCIIFDKVYKSVLDSSLTRPLDYDYLKTLTPKAQRFYEIVSYSIFSALKNKRQYASMRYSEYCMYAAEARKFSKREMQKQMSKVHSPHKKSGYIASVKWESTIDEEGNPDWLILYQPGQKAEAEFVAIHKKPIKTQYEPDSQPIVKKEEEEFEPSSEIELQGSFLLDLVRETAIKIKGIP